MCCKQKHINKQTREKWEMKELDNWIKLSKRKRDYV